MEALQALGDGVGGLAFSCQAGDVGAAGQGGGVAGAEDQAARLTVPRPGPDGCVHPARGSVAAPARRAAPAGRFWAISP
jgi:hypothetical protein